MNPPASGELDGINDAAVVEYASQILLEEDTDENAFMFEPSLIEAAERSFYDAIGEIHFPPTDHRSRSSFHGNFDGVSPNEGSAWSGGGNYDDGGINDDAIEFLPMDDNSLLYLEKPEEATQDGTYRKKSPLVEEDRSRKQFQRYSEPEERSEIFDQILLCSREREAVLREAFQRMVLSERAQAKGEDVVDLLTMLILCAQAVSADDRRVAVNLLKQLRQHASPTGDGMQRLSYYFAKGLEARLAGYGTEIFKALVAAERPVTDVLKYYHMFLAICPFRKAVNYLSNKTIVNLAEKSRKIHIVDFGNCYGFQWPSLMQRLSYRAGGSPEIRMTAIDFPLPGFRPLEGLQDCGRRLASYAETFKVPFKYDAIAAKWDEAKIEDIRIEPDEVTIVNCVDRLEDLLDESVVEESPRDTFLSLIRSINPKVFIQAIVNSGHGSPFFKSRFQEALFHFSATFDMLDVTIPRDCSERMMLERELFGQKVMNTIACEGIDRTHRPETYKKWHQRNVRAGFVPLPMDREIFNTAKDTIVHRYHNDFYIEEDGGWLLQGWKGRVMYAVSTWKPATSS